MAKQTGRNVTCKVCFQSTTMPTANPPFGSHLTCSHCKTPVVTIQTPQGGIPLSVPQEVVRRHTGFTGRCLIHPFCPWCNEINYAVVAPSEGRTSAWLAKKEVANANDFFLSVECDKCGQGFVVEWDEPPLPSSCSLCRVKLSGSHRSAFDPRFCGVCGDKISRVHERRKGEDAPGRLRGVVVVGFSRMPIPREIAILRRRDKEVGEAPVSLAMLSGGYPASGVESAMIVVDMVESEARKLAGAPGAVVSAAGAVGTSGLFGGMVPELGKLTYQRFGPLLVVKVWE